MFQIDEKVLSDSRTLISVQGKKHQIDHLTKNGTINYTLEGDNLWLTTPKVRRAYVSKNDATESYDKIVIARDGTNIDGSYEFDDSITFNDNLEVKKDLVVRGNFTVEGDSTVIDTPRLTIEDNIIELNRNEAGNGISLKISGTAINRGQKPFARTIYDEDQKGFVFDVNTNMEAPVDPNNWTAIAYTEQNGEYSPGEFRARRRFIAPFGRFSDTVEVGNKVLTNHLTVINTTDLRGPAVTSDITVRGALVANSTTTLHGLLTANSPATFKDNVTMEKSLLVKDFSEFQGISTFKNGIIVTANGANITGESRVSGKLSVTEDALFNKDVCIQANMLCSNSTTVFKATVGELESMTNAKIGGNTDIEKDLTVIGKTKLNNEVEINNGPLTVNSLAEFNNNVNINNKNLTISSNSSNNGCLTVGGNTALQGTLDVDKDANFDGKVVIHGALEMTGSDIIARNVTTKNDFIVENGNGKGLRFWNSDNFKIYMADISHSGRMDSTSDYNMYFKMSAGTNRGFVFKNESVNLLQIEGSGQVRVKEKIIAHGYDVITRENEGHKTDSNGINADKLDNLHATDFLRRNVATDTTEDIEFKTAGKAIKFAGGGSIYKNGSIIVKTDNAINNGFKVKSEADTDLLTVKDHEVNGLLYKMHTVWHRGNQGHDSGMDADTLDGRHASYFSPSTHLHDDRYIRNDEVNLKGKYKIEYNEAFDSLDFMYMGDTP